MFHKLSTAQLEKLLDQLSVPMSVIERDATLNDFRIRGMNRAFEELSGLARADILGRSITEFADAAQEAIDSYQRCIATRESIRFSFVFAREAQRARWDKTLQYCQSPEGYDRIIATAIRMQDEMPVLQDRLALDDLSYFSSIVDLQLENLSTAFSAVSQSDFAPLLHQDRIVRLEATCRTIQSTVSDIKKVVRRAQGRYAPSNLYQLNAPGDAPVERDKKQGPATPGALSTSLSRRQDSAAG